MYTSNIVPMEATYESSDFVSVQSISSLFKRHNFPVDENISPLPSIFEGEDINLLVDKIFLISNNEDREIQILLIKTHNTTLQGWRNRTLKQLKKGTQTGKVVLYTSNFEQFFIGITSLNGSKNLPRPFVPSDPTPDMSFFLEELLTSDGSTILDIAENTAEKSLKTHDEHAKELFELLRDKPQNTASFFKSTLHLKQLSQFANVFLVRKDAPVKDAIIFLDRENDITKSYKQLEASYPKIVSQFLLERDESLKYIILLSHYHVIIYDDQRRELGKIVLSFDNSENEKMVETQQTLTSLVAGVDVKAAFNSDTFGVQFGRGSVFHIICRHALEKDYKAKEKELKVIREEWRKTFERVYRPGDLEKDLFFQHAYLATLIKIVLFTKFPGSSEKNKQNDKNSSKKRRFFRSEQFKELIQKLEEKGADLFLNDFYGWTLDIDVICNLLLSALDNAVYEVDDIFRTIYQDMVAPATRRATGEFYTPGELARYMVEDSYVFGKTVLDPACGSGTFLVELVHSIVHDNYDRPLEERIDAANKIYGFDINPIAILASKANLIVNHIDLLDHGFLPNVFLNDSLVPLKLEEKKVSVRDRSVKHEQARLSDSDGTASHELYARYKLGTSIIKSTSKDNETGDQRESGEYGNIDVAYPLLNDQNRPYFFKSLRYADSLIRKDTTWEDIEKKIEQRIKLSPESGNQLYVNNPHLWTNFLSIVKTCYDLAMEEKNHIWLYLLYNAIGANSIRNKVDIVIGNPPWVVLNKIYSKHYQAKMKQLSEKYGIYMGGKTATSTEITSLFFYCCQDIYLKKTDTSSIFFVTPISLMAGGQHDRFRRFLGFKTPAEIWTFSGEKLFTVENICIKVVNLQEEKQENKTQDKYLPKALVTSFSVKREDKIREIEKNRVAQLYVPNNYKEIRSKFDLHKRLIPQERVKDLLPLGETPYRSKFRMGATLVPRNLVFFTKHSYNEQFYTLTPAKVASKRPWTFLPFPLSEHKLIEKEYMFECCVSKDLVPFLLLQTRTVFLPTDRELQYDDSLKPEASSLYSLLNEKYKQHKKETSPLQTLKDRMNYQKGLSHQNQGAKYKVIYPAAGSFIKAALLENHEIIESCALLLSCRI